MTSLTLRRFLRDRFDFDQQVWVWKLMNGYCCPSRSVNVKKLRIHLVVAIKVIHVHEER